MSDNITPQSVNISVTGTPLEKLADTVGYLIQAVVNPVSTAAQSISNGVSNIVGAYTHELTTDIHRRAEARRRVEEVREQQNLDEVIAGAAKMLPPKTSDSPVSPDWVTQFAEHVKRVSDDDMQALWSKILAGEIETPGSFSKRTLQVVKDLERIELEKFSALCSFLIRTPGNGQPWLPFRVSNNPIFKSMEERGIEFSSYVSLADAGLLGTDGRLVLLPEVRETTDVGFFEFDITCGDSIFTIRTTSKKPEIAIRGLSAAGCEIAHLANAKPPAEYLVELHEWLEHNHGIGSVTRK